MRGAAARGRRRAGSGAMERPRPHGCPRRRAGSAGGASAEQQGSSRRQRCERPRGFRGCWVPRCKSGGGSVIAESCFFLGWFSFYCYYYFFNCYFYAFCKRYQKNRTTSERCWQLLAELLLFGCDGEKQQEATLVLPSVEIGLVHGLLNVDLQICSRSWAREA